MMFLIQIDNSFVGIVLAAYLGLSAYFYRKVIALGEDMASMKYYIERQTKDAAIRLEQLSNPTPPEKQKLLQKYRLDIITKEECAELITWLETLGTNPDAEAAERSAALQILTGVKTAAMLESKKRRWLWRRVPE